MLLEKIYINNQSIKNCHPPASFSFPYQNHPIANSIGRTENQSYKIGKKTNNRNDKINILIHC